MQELHITVKNQPGVLKAVTEVLFGANINIEYLHVEPTSGDEGEMVVKAHSDLQSLVEGLKAVSGVVDVQ